MNIIFREDLPIEDQRYTVLQLDTFEFFNGPQHTAWCVVENIPIQELAHVSANKNLHADLIKNYAKQNWTYCEQALEHLMGKWGGELDTFYTDLASRIEQLKTQELDDSWSPVIPKS